MPNKIPITITARTEALIARLEDPAARDALTRLGAEVADVLAKVQSLDTLSRELPRNSLEERERLVNAWPLARAALAATDRLLAVVREAFPEPPASASVDEALDAAFGGPDVPVEKPPENEPDPAAAVRAIAWAVSHEVELVRKMLAGPIPSTAETSWRSFVGLQEFRGKVRGGVSELMYLACRVHAPVTREEVIPGYLEGLGEALALRREVARLGRTVLPLCLRVKQSTRADLGPAVEALAQVIGEFCASPAFATLRLADRKVTQLFRKRVQHLCDAPAPGPATDVSEDLARFIEGLAVISRREMLVIHDAAELRACLDRLESPDVPETRLFEAIRIARTLEGLDPELDALLSAASAWDSAGPPAGVAEATAALRKLINGLSAGRTPTPAGKWTIRGTAGDDGLG